MKTEKTALRLLVCWRWMGATLAVCGLLLSPLATFAGQWVALENQPGKGIETMLLLSDGSVMGQDGGNNDWIRLTPGSTGGYTNGVWVTNIANMNYSRLYYSSQVLTNGKVFVAGGEYNSGSDYAEVYDPVANTWTVAPTPPGGAVNFADSISEILPNGNVLVSPVHPSSYGGTLIWDTAAGNWSVGPTLYAYGSSSEESWVKLPDTSILGIIALDNGGAPGTTTERYIPSENEWIGDASLDFQVWADICGAQACFVGEEGPAFLLSNGKAIFMGGSGATAIYTPSGSTSDGSWTQGTTIPAGLGAADTPGAMINNGNILCAFGNIPYVSGTNLIWNGPTYFYTYTYNSSGGSFSSINAPAGGSSDPGVEYNDRMLDLPDGTVLFTDGGSQLYCWVPSSGPLASGQPSITSINYNNDGTLLLTGTLFNGISEGAAYGDDAQMNSDYPIVAFNSGGTVYYGRTFNWNSTSVMTGSQIVSTECSIPVDLPPGPCTIQVIANGNASPAYAFDGPVWVDFNYTGPFFFGDYYFPYDTLAEGVSAVSSGGAIFINASTQPSDSSETLTITNAMTIISVYGASDIGGGD